MNRAKLDEVITLVSRVIEPAGFECIEAEWAAGERILRLYVDRLEGQTPARQGASSAAEQTLDSRVSENRAQENRDGIDLEGCVAASRLLVDLEELDVLVPGQYTLEVSSPGIERPLRLAKHFEKHIGETVQIKLAAKELPRRNGTGRLIDITGDDANARVTVETEQGPWTFPLAALQRASLIYDWNTATRH